VGKPSCDPKKIIATVPYVMTRKQPPEYGFEDYCYSTRKISVNSLRL